MFEKFGEFDSCEELNQAAAGLFKEGDMENILVMAKENGIDEEYVNMYIAGDIPVLADGMLAALGKIDMELPEAMKTYGTIALYAAEFIKSLCEQDLFAKAVRRKGKSLACCLDKMRSMAEKQVKVKSGTQCVCIPPSAGHKIIRDYYMEENHEQKKTK